MLACAGFASCSQEMQDIPSFPSGEVQGAGYPLELTVGGLQAVATSGKASVPGTRSTVDNDWNGVTTVAVQVGGEVKAYTATSADGGNTATLTSTDPFFWESANERKTITAWHPYSASYPENWTVKADQNTDGNYEASDLIKGELTDLAFANRNTPMTFHHQTAKVTVNLTAGNGGTLDESPSVQLLNVSGVEGGGTAITPYRPNDTKQTYLALLNGQTIAAGREFIQITTNGIAFAYRPGAPKELAAGMAYTFNITVKAEGLDVTVRESIAWNTDGTSGSGSITLPEVIDLAGGTPVNITDNRTYLITGTGESQQGITIEGSPTITFQSVNVGAETAIEIRSGNPKLVFEGTNSLESTGEGKGAISLSGNASVEISGSGTLNLTANNADTWVYGWQEGAILGSAGSATCGDISISGVTLNITANACNAAIGSGEYNSSCGDILITDATIRITDCSGGAGIGTSTTYQGTSSCGDIRIKNSDIEIGYGNYFAIHGPAIGCSALWNYDSTVKGIYITLKEGQTRDDFLSKLVTTTATSSDKVGRGYNGSDKCGTITNGIHWYDSAGNEITE